MREANYWLRIIAATQLMGHQSVPALLEESSELVAILTAIVSNTVANQGKKGEAWFALRSSKFVICGSQRAVS